MGAGLGVILGGTLGYRLGRRADAREERRAREASVLDAMALERFHASKRITQWTIILMLAVCVLMGILVDVLEQRPRAFMPMLWVGLFASVPTTRIATRRTKWPKFLGTLTGAVGGGLAGVIGSSLVGCILCGTGGAFLGCFGARIWDRRGRRFATGS